MDSLSVPYYYGADTATALGGVPDFGGILPSLAGILAGWASTLARGNEARVTTTALTLAGYARDPAELDRLTRQYEAELNAYLRQVDLPRMATDVAEGLGPRDLAEIAAGALPGPSALIAAALVGAGITYVALK